tara:strand:- start:7471 stop:9558 length:2088 start_codon:yes stop_codon:yes gene_type:complete
VEEKVNILRRVYIFFFVLVLFGLAIIAKVVNIQIFKGNEILNNVKTTSTKRRSFPAERGDLYAKDGSLLATSLTYYDVGLDLTSKAMSGDTLSKYINELSDSLASLIGGKTSTQYKQEILSAYKNKIRWYQIHREVNYPDFKKLKKFPFINKGRYKSGLAYSKYTKRKKPFGVLASRTIGSRSPFGLEGAYDAYLKGDSGRQFQRKIPGGVWVPVNDNNSKEPIDGSDVYSTIDINIQEVAENALRDQLFYNKADYGCAVVMEVATGKVRAIANLKVDTLGNYWEAKNYAVADAQEPGSTIKLASFMAVLENKKIDIDKKTVDIGHGIYNVYDRKIRDSHYYPKNTSLTVREIFEKSSNVGTVKLIEELYKKNPQEYIDRLYSFGLGEKLDLDIIGEISPKIKNTYDNDWYGTTLQWTCHGYETLFTPMQILAFYNAVANNGKLVKPCFIEKVIDENQKETTFPPIVIESSICSQKTVTSLKSLLEGVVTRGTAVRPFKGSLYKVAGKTGTAKINYAKNGKNKVEYRSSFAGYFPADNPRFSCIVVITNPRVNGIYGGVTAAPVFRKISDRVYALDKELRAELIAESSSDAMKIKSGIESEVVEVMKELSIKSDARGSSAYVRSSVKDNFLKTSDYTITRNKVANVKGMTVRDALFILEQQGLTVKVTGKGKVVKQSLSPGSAIIKGKQIEIILG